MSEFFGIVKEYLMRRYGEEGMLIAVLIALLRGLHTSSRTNSTLSRRYAKLGLWILIVFALAFTFYPPLYNWQRDARYAFDEINENTVKLLISDFNSNSAKLGIEFTNSFYENLITITKNEENIQIDKHFYRIRIEVKRTNQTWTEHEVRTRGKRRGADIGVIGIYNKFTLAQTTTYEVDSLQCVILDTSLATVLESQKPVESLFDLSVRMDAHAHDDGLTIMVGKVSNPVLYLTRLAINLQLLKIAHLEKDVTQQLKILKKVNQGFAEIAELINSPAIADFHKANSLFRNSQLTAEPDQKEKYLHYAVKHYQASIDTFKKDSSIKIIKYDPVKPYFNLAETYRKLSSLSKKNTWLDDAETTYEQAAANFPSLITAQELVGFLEERLDSYSMDGGIPAREFGRHVEKYLKWNQALSNYVKQGDKPYEERQAETNALEKKRASWEQRRRTYTPKSRP